MLPGHRKQDGDVEVLTHGDAPGRGLPQHVHSFSMTSGAGASKYDGSRTAEEAMILYTITMAVWMMHMTEGRE